MNSKTLEKFDALPLGLRDKRLVKEFIEALVTELQCKPYKFPVKLTTADLKPGATFRNRSEGSTEVITLIRQDYPPAGPGGWLLGGLRGDKYHLYNSAPKTDHDMLAFLNDYYTPIE